MMKKYPAELNRNCIDVQDLPKCRSREYRRESSIPSNKVKIATPDLQRSDIFYNKWKKEEIKIFEKLYIKLSGSSNASHVFDLIANNLPNKTIGDCVRYYYLFKHIRPFKTKSKKNKKKRKKKKA